jgi:hypothetical protein
MVLETIGIILVVIGALVSIGKYRYENGLSKYSRAGQQ